MQKNAQQWSENFLHHLKNERRLSPHTLNYQRDLRGITDYCDGVMVAEWITRDAKHVRAWLASRHRQGVGGRSLA